MWVYDCHLNVTDVSAVNLELMAQSTDAYIQVWLLGGKVGSPAAPVLYTTVHVTAWMVSTLTIPLGNAAFTGGYGAIELTSVTGSGGSPARFACHVLEATSATNLELAWTAITGSWFEGKAFTLPIPLGNARTQQVVHICATLETFATSAFSVTFNEIGLGGWTYSQTLQPGMTWRWDSLSAGVNVNLQQTIAISCNANIVASAWRSDGPIISRVHLLADQYAT